MKEREEREKARVGPARRERNFLNPRKSYNLRDIPLPPTTQNELAFTIIDFLICINLHQPIDFHAAIAFLFCFVIVLRKGENGMKKGTLSWTLRGLGSNSSSDTG